MKNIYERFRNIIFVFFLFLAAFLIIYMSQRNYGDDYNLKHMSITGEYAINNGSWQKLDWSDPPVNLSDVHTLKIRGKFNEPLNSTDSLMIKLNHLLCEIKVNDSIIYAEEPMDQNRMLHSNGEKWISVQHGNITTNDLIEIKLSTIYTVNSNDALVEFFHQMYGGSERSLYQHLLKANGISLYIGIMLSCIGIIIAVVASILSVLKVQNTKKLFVFSEFIFVSGLWLLVKNDIIIFFAPNSIALNVIDIFCQYFISFLALRYAAFYCSDWRYRHLNACKKVCFAYIVLTTILDLFTRYDFYNFIPFGICLNIWIIFIIAFCIISEFKHTKKMEIKFLLVSSTILILGGLLEVINFVSGILPVSSIFSVCFCIFTVSEIAIFVYELKQTADEAARVEKLEKELVKSKVSIMMTQIQPHFLYNSLAAIKQLCDENPQKASYAIDYFSNYLRGNFDSITSTVPIPFEKELKHVKNYLRLEKMRFEDRLNIDYEINYTDFVIPPLTLQPIVETAIRFGVTKKEEGGTVTIRVMELDENTISIRVTDNGIGYNPDCCKDSRNMIVLNNIKKRIEEQCHGNMQFHSQPQIGTTVEITLPK